MSTHVIDSHVGKKIRELRNLAGVSQTKLADSLGMSFQQVQKYETGANRVSASKLFEIASYFNAPIGAFFPEQEGSSEFEGISPDEAGLVRSYREASPQIRSAIRSLARSFGNDNDIDRSSHEDAERD